MQAVAELRSSLTEEQHELRRHGVGASEAAAVIGRSLYAGPVDVWRNKRERRKREPETVPQKRGRLLEDGILTWYEEDMGLKLVRKPDTKFSTEFPHVCATPDGLLPGEARPFVRAVDAKALRWDRTMEFGQQGTDDIPDDYLVQLQIQMGVFGAYEAHLAVLFGGDDFRVYHVKFNPALWQRVGEAVEEFWKLYVETGKPPPVDATQGYSNWLSEHFQERKTTTIRQASPEEITWLEELRIVEGQLKACKERKEILRNYLKQAIGNDYGIKGGDFKALWTGGNEGSRVDWKALAEALLQKYPDETRTMLALATTQEFTARQLRVTF